MTILPYAARQLRNIALLSSLVLHDDRANELINTRQCVDLRCVMAVIMKYVNVHGVVSVGYSLQGRVSWAIEPQN